MTLQSKSSISVSIIIPIFNKYHYLQRSITSTREQTLSNIEILPIDDCSSDNSSNYLIEQMNEDPRIKLIQHIYNQGISSSRIHGVLFSKGEYIISLDPDDRLYNNSCELSYKSAIDLNADIVEFEIFAFRRFVRNYTMHTCPQNYTDGKILLKLFQKFDYFTTNFNLIKKIIKREIYLKAVKLLLPLIGNKRICVAEDFLHTAAIYLFMKNYYCGHFLAYVYYRDLKDSSTNMRYVSRYQTSIQSIFTDYLARYLYHNRDNLSRVSLSLFLINESHTILYNKVKNIDKKPVKKCFNESGFHCSQYFDIGSCFITKIVAKK